MGMTLLETSMERWKKEQAEEGRAHGLEEGLKKGLAEGLEKGLEQGLEKGLEQGLEQGQRELLATQLELRFGPDASRQERLAQLDSKALKQVSIRVLTAQTEEEVFAD